MSQHELSDIQRKIYKFLLKTVRDRGIPPSRARIKEEMGLRTTSHVQYHLQMLEKAGWIELLLGEDYGIRLLKRGIPLKGYIAAGQPVESFVELDQMIDLGPELEDERNYVLIVKGNSMIEDGIFNGDYVVVRQQNTCERGQVIVAAHLVEPFSATLKRFTRESGEVCLIPVNSDKEWYNDWEIHGVVEEGKVSLKPANKGMRPIYVSSKEWYDEWQIQGIVIAVHRPYSWKIR